MLLGKHDCCMYTSVKDNRLACIHVCNPLYFSCNENRRKMKTKISKKFKSGCQKTPTLEQSHWIQGDYFAINDLEIVFWGYSKP